MRHVLATAHPFGLGDGRADWDWWPLVGSVLLLALVRYGFRAGFRAWTFGLALAFGPFFSLAVDAWGIVPVFAVAVLLGAAAAAARRPQLR